MRAPALASVLALALTAGRAGAADAPAPSWATVQATELSRQAAEHAARGDSGTAVARYLEAVKLDPTFAPGYLGLAAQYEARGDLVEAERTYAVALEHVPGFADGLVARARLRARTHRQHEAIADLEAAATLQPEAVPLLRELLAAYVAARALPAALSVARRLVMVADEQRDAGAASEAKVKVKALAMLVGEADPVTAGRSGRGAVRNALAGAGRRR